jgi:CAAX protease family protein
MKSLPDLLYVAWFALIGPVIDYVFFWPAFRRQSQIDPTRARMWGWAWTIVSSWPLVAVGAALWVWNDRSWTLFGFSVPDGWRLWTSIALILMIGAYHILAIMTVARSEEQRASLRQQMGKTAALMPHTRKDLAWFGGVSLTAGFCEEFWFRGYFIWVFAPWLGWWGAAALSLLIFAVAHVYLGWNGVLRVGIVGAIYTLVVAILGSLWPAIALHAIIDLGAGAMAWLALRGVQATGGVTDVERPTETQSASGVESSPAQAEPGTALDRQGM